MSPEPLGSADPPKGTAGTPSQSGPAHSQIARLDAACDRFEAAWRAGRGPQIEEFLEEVIATERHAFLGELIRLELELRRADGQEPHEHDYRLRFPEQSTVIDAAFETTETSMAVDGDRSVGESTSSEEMTSTLRCQPRDLSRTAPIPTRGSGTKPEELGSTAGTSRFRVLDSHARGGLGEVFLARDEELGRTVALKQMQARCLNKPDLRQRFVLEAKINGNLEHPGIVPVYGFGTDVQGRPYYAMRFIEGETLKQAIAHYHEEAPTLSATDRSLRLRNLLGRFVDVCEAIAYAHARGILHRDLKPANVMLGAFGETLLIDWGLAKLIGNEESRREGDGEAFATPTDYRLDPTVVGSAMGTPAYMSPEQAEGRLDDLGPATDVYGLGATLTALLSGRPPIDGATTDEVLAKVRRGEIVSPRVVVPDTPRPLEAICLKAMAHQPGDRYPGARALAEDVERYLADEPVAALPDPIVTRAWRWVRRHRTATVSAVAALAVAVIALALGVALLGEANAQIRDQERVARENLDESRRVVSAMFQRVVPQLTGQPGMDETRREVLETALRFYEDFILPRGDNLIIRAEIAEALLQVGRAREALGKIEEAQVAYQQAGEQFEALLSQFPNDPDIGSALAQVLRDQADLLKRIGRTVEAESLYRRALSTAQAGAASSSDVPSQRAEIARLVFKLALLADQNDQWSEAEEGYREALAIQEDLVASWPDNSAFLRDLVSTLYELGYLRARLGFFDEASRMYERLVEIQEGLLVLEPGNKRYLSALRDYLSYLGTLQGRAGRFDVGLETHTRALELGAMLCVAHPGVVNDQIGLVKAYGNLGNYYRRAGRPADAASTYRRALDVIEAVVRDHPEITDHALTRAQLGTDLALATQQQGRDAEALSHLDPAIEALEALAGAAGNESHRLAVLESAYINRFEIHDALGDPQRALADLSRAESLPIQNDRTAEFRAREAIQHGRMGQLAEASALIDQAIAAPETNDEVFFQAARALAVSAKVAEDNWDDAESVGIEGSDQRTRIEQAIALLRRARALRGFLTREAIARLDSPDFDALRNHDDFRTLRADLDFPDDPFQP